MAEENNDCQTALMKIEMILANCPEYAELKFKKMMCLARSDRLKDALNYMKEIHDKHNSDPRYFYASGFVYMYKGSSEHAVRMWRKANEQDPDNDKYQKAVKNWRKAEKLKADANALFKAGELDKAYEMYKAATEIDKDNLPFNSVVFSNMGTCLTKQKKFKEALGDFNAAIRMNPKYAKAYHKRGNCHRELKK